MTLLDGKGERVISRRLARESRHTSVPGFDGRGIDGSSPHSRLQEHGVDVGLLQFVEDVGKFLLLLFCRSSRLGIGVRPVESSDGSEPYRPHFVLWVTDVLSQSRKGAKYGQ